MLFARNIHWNNYSQNKTEDYRQLTIETFIGLIIIACIGAYFVWRNNVKVRQAIAAADFRRVFNADVIFDIDTLSVIFDNHKEAARIFKPHIVFFKQRSFNQKWEDYDKWANKILKDSKNKPSSIYKIELGLKNINIQTEFKNHVKLLLKFAKTT